MSITDWSSRSNQPAGDIHSVVFWWTCNTSTGTIVKCKANEPPLMCLIDGDGNQAHTQLSVHVAQGMAIKHLLQCQLVLYDFQLGS